MTAAEVRERRIRQLQLFMEEQERREAQGLPLEEKYPTPEPEFTRLFNPENDDVFNVMIRICESHPKFGLALLKVLRTDTDFKSKF